MVAKRMSFGAYTLHQRGLRSSVPPYTEERGLGVARLQCVKNPGRYFGRWSIVEGQVRHAFRGRHTPQQLTEQGLDQFGDPVEVHGLA